MATYEFYDTSAGVVVEISDTTPGEETKAAIVVSPAKGVGFNSNSPDPGFTVFITGPSGGSIWTAYATSYTQANALYTKAVNAFGWLPASRVKGSAVMTDGNGNVVSAVHHDLPTTPEQAGQGNLPAGPVLPGQANQPPYTPPNKPTDPGKPANPGKP